MSSPLLPEFNSGPVERWSGESRGWRYMACRIDGTGVFAGWLTQELPLNDVTVSDVLSGPPQLSATISPMYQWLFAADGELLLREYSTMIYAEADGILRFGGLLVGLQADGPSLQVECSGLTSYIKDRPYDSSKEFIEADPLDVVRHIWSWVQGQPASNVGLQIDSSTKTTQRVGQAAVVGTTPQQSQEAKPLLLNPTDITDLGGLVDELAEATPFDYRERVAWNSTKTLPLHFLDFGYPRMGFRRGDLRFVLGENVQTVPTIERDAANFSNYVRVRGAGEGSVMVSADAVVLDGRLRRVVTVDDRSIQSSERARARARIELAKRQNTTHVRSLRARNTGNARLGAARTGDEIRVQAETEWIDVDLWCRVVSIGTNPNDPEMMTFGLKRSDTWA